MRQETTDASGRAKAASCKLERSRGGFEIWSFARNERSAPTAPSARRGSLVLPHCAQFGVKLMNAFDGRRRARGFRQTRLWGQGRERRGGGRGFGTITLNHISKPRCGLRCAVQSVRERPFGGVLHSVQDGLKRGISSLRGKRGRNAHGFSCQRQGHSPGRRRNWCENRHGFSFLVKRICDQSGGNQ